MSAMNDARTKISRDIMRMAILPYVYATKHGHIHVVGLTKSLMTIVVYELHSKRKIRDTLRCMQMYENDSI
jgi:hypothetical protein